MKRHTRFLAVLLSLLLMASLSACKTGGDPQEMHTAPDGQTAESAADPTPEPTPAPEEEGAVPTPAPEGEDEQHHSMLPAPETGSDAFIAEFMQNPIDARYESDMNDAASGSAMVSACTTATAAWKEQIDAVYRQILNSADEKKASEVKKAQEEWIDHQNDALQEIRNEVSEEDAMASVTVAENIMLYYRSRAIDLCAVLYEIDGQLAFG